MTPTPTEQRPQECEHWCNGICGLMPEFILLNGAFALNVWCRGVCPDFTPKTEKKCKSD